MTATGLALLLVAACGQKGPLTLPAPPAQAATPGASVAPAAPAAPASAAR